MTELPRQSQAPELVDNRALILGIERLRFDNDKSAVT